MTFNFRMFTASSPIKHGLTSSRETDKEPQALNLAFQASLRSRFVEQQKKYSFFKQHGPFPTWISLHATMLMMSLQDSALLPITSVKHVQVKQMWTGIGKGIGTIFFHVFHFSDFLIGFQILLARQTGLDCKYKVQCWSTWGIRNSSAVAAPWWLLAIFTDT